MRHFDAFLPGTAFMPNMASATLTLSVRTVCLPCSGSRTKRETQAGAHGECLLRQSGKFWRSLQYCAIRFKRISPFRQKQNTPDREESQSRFKNILAQGAALTNTPGMTPDRALLRIPISNSENGWRMCLDNRRRSLFHRMGAQGNGSRFRISRSYRIAHLPNTTLVAVTSISHCDTRSLRAAFAPQKSGSTAVLPDFFIARCRLPSLCGALPCLCAAMVTIRHRGIQDYNASYSGVPSSPSVMTSSVGPSSGCGAGGIYGGTYRLRGS